jgi:hypothetical protein
VPASARSLRVTDAYRTRILAIRTRLERDAERRWPGIEDDFQPWLAATAAAVAGAQREAIRATSGYLSAYLTSELGSRATPPPLQADRYVGFSRDGRPLTESLESPLIGVRADLAKGLAPARALSEGLNRAVRMVGVDLDHAHRTALTDGMAADERIEGWQRGTQGTCGACAGDIAVEVTVNLPSVPLRIHPSCQCVTVPVVIGVPNRFPLPTGQQIFDGKTKAEQDEMLGPEVAEQVRAGDASLADLVQESPLNSDQDPFITQAPVGAE